MEKFNYLRSQNADYIEELYQLYLENPDSVDETWRYFFEGIDLGSEVPLDAHAASNGISANGTTQLSSVPSANVSTLTPVISAEAKVGELIQTYREIGGYLANVNPLENAPKSHPSLELKAFDLAEADLDRQFTAASRLGLPAPSTLRTILQHLRETYCGSTAVEFTHIQNAEIREWLQKKNGVLKK